MTVSISIEIFALWIFVFGLIVAGLICMIYEYKKSNKKIEHLDEENTKLQEEILFRQDVHEETDYSGMYKKK